MGYIISILNNKGGTGKTTGTVNLADALGKKGRSVLVADMDNQCNCTSKLLPKNTHIRKSLYDLLDPEQQQISLDDFFYPSSCRSVLLPNISDTASLEPELMLAAPESFFKLRRILREYAVARFDYTLVDCPPNMGTFVMIALMMSDFVIVPIKAGSTDSIEGLKKATMLVRQIGEKQNPDLRFLRILINFRDRRTSISKAVISQIREAFAEDQVFQTEIPVNTAFEKAEAQNETVFRTDATSSGARAFRSLAKELISILEGSSHEEKEIPA